MIRYYNPQKNTLVIPYNKPPMKRLKEEGWYTVPERWDIAKIKQYFNK